MGIQVLEAVAAALAVIALSVWVADFGLRRIR
jgi:preprotein translocase subunit SecE